MRLILFDIDGTLICSSSVGREVVAHALRHVFGSDGLIGQVSFAGKTDLAIILDSMIPSGFPESDVRLKLPAVYRQMALYGQEIFPKNKLEACQGVLDLLKQLTRNDEIIMGLQTGNNDSTAPLKLRAAEIEPKLFSIGAFGSDAYERAALIPIAWERAQGKTGLHFSGENTIVIGDTPADIECATANGAVSVAVATGTYSAAALAMSKPTYLFDNFTDLPLTLDTLLK